jgi:hypothetical protein
MSVLATLDTRRGWRRASAGCAWDSVAARPGPAREARRRRHALSTGAGKGVDQVTGL